MDTLTWHTINGHRSVLRNYQRKIFGFGSNKRFNFDLYGDLKSLDAKWFLDENGKLNYEYRYKLTKFDSKQFYKEFIQCIEDNSDPIDFRDLRILRIIEGESLYSRNKIERKIIW